MQGGSDSAAQCTISMKASLFKCQLCAIRTARSFELASRLRNSKASVKHGLAVDLAQVEELVHCFLQSTASGIALGELAVLLQN